MYWQFPHPFLDTTAIKGMSWSAAYCLVYVKLEHHRFNVGVDTRESRIVFKSWSMAYNPAV